MLWSELQELISSKEGPKLEFKQVSVSAETLAKAIVAFANMRGGTILLGVKDDGTIDGIAQKDGIHEWLMDTVIGHHVNPHVLPEYKEVQTPDGVVVAVIEIPQGNAKPHALRRNKREDIYVRYGNTSQLATRDQIVRLAEAGGLLATEKLPVYGSSMRDLDKLRCREYFREILEHREEDLSEESLKDLMITHDFLVGDFSNLHCSIGAHLLFATSPHQRLPQAGLRLTVYEGKDKTHTPQFDKVYDGPLVEYRGQRQASDPIEKALHNNTRIPEYISHEEIIDMVRTRIWDYPELAVRELIVNALVHRDWTKQDYARISVYADRLEVTSPGSLPNGMTITKIKQGVTTPRNPTMARVLRGYGYLESQGMGIRRTVMPLMKEHNNTAPEFDATEDYFKVTLRKHASVGNAALTRAIENSRELDHESLDEREILHNAVLPVLHALGWDTSDREEVCPGYSTTGRRRIAVALLIRGKPAVFLDITTRPQEEWASFIIELQNISHEMAEPARSKMPDIVLTNGIDWQKVTFPDSAEVERYKITDISLCRDETDKISEKFESILSKARIFASMGHSDPTI